MFRRTEEKFYLRFYDLANKTIGEDITFPIPEGELEKFDLPEGTAYIKVHDNWYFYLYDEIALMIYIGKRLSHEEYRKGDYKLVSIYERAFKRGEIGWEYNSKRPDFCYICKSEDKPKDINIVSYLEDGAIVVPDKEKLKKIIIEISKELSEKYIEMTNAGLDVKSYKIGDFVSSQKPR